MDCDLFAASDLAFVHLPSHCISILLNCAFPYNSSNADDEILPDHDAPRSRCLYFRNYHYGGRSEWGSSCAGNCIYRFNSVGGGGFARHLLGRNSISVVYRDDDSLWHRQSQLGSAVSISHG